MRSRNAATFRRFRVPCAWPSRSGLWERGEPTDWTLDVKLGEDASLGYGKKAPKNLGLIRNIAINAY